MPLRNILKRVASKLPSTVQSDLKRRQFRREIRRGRFYTDEKEFALLEQWLSAGDWALDIGANIGHYTLRMSNLVGDKGRVIAFEPVPETFSLLAANVALFPLSNVTLLNVAASNGTDVVGVSIPTFPTGLDNYYMAQLSRDSSDLNVMTISADRLGISNAVSLIKIDAEGHEMPVLEGLRALIERDRPTLIVEDSSPQISEFLEKFGYQAQRLAGSSNLVFEIRQRSAEAVAGDESGIVER